MIHYKDLDRMIEEAKAYLKASEEAGQISPTANRKTLSKKVGNVSLKTVRLSSGASKVVTKL